VLQVSASRPARLPTHRFRSFWDVSRYVAGPMRGRCRAVCRLRNGRVGAR
jgi:hypothetical protein